MLGEHYKESFAMVVRYKSVRILPSIIASHGLKIGLINFIGAYLNTKPQGNNYLEIFKEFKDHYKIPGTMNYTLYRTMDSGNNWFFLTQ